MKAEPIKNHAGPCGPDAGCDGACMDAAACERRNAAETHGYWECKRCGEQVPPSHVTYVENHDGGCGGACEWVDINTPSVDGKIHILAEQLNEWKKAAQEWDCNTPDELRRRIYDLPATY